MSNVISHETSVLKAAGVKEGSKMLNWMALNFGESFHHCCAVPYLKVKFLSMTSAVTPIRPWNFSFATERPSIYTHFGADLSVLDFWCPVAMGCAVVVAPAEDLKDVGRVAALVQQHQIASTSIVPSMCQVHHLSYEFV